MEGEGEEVEDVRARGREHEVVVERRGAERGQYLPELLDTHISKMPCELESERAAEVALYVACVDDVASKLATLSQDIRDRRGARIKAT